MIKNLIAVISVCFSFNIAFAGDVIKPLNNSLNGFDKWGDVVKEQPVIIGDDSISLGDLYDILEETKHLKYCLDVDGEDNWQTPQETLARGCGDCEDISIVWYYLAREKGFSADKLNLLVGYIPRLNNIAHVVLGVQIGGVEYVLDSYNQGGDLKRAEIYQGDNFQLLYRINENGWGVK